MKSKHVERLFYSLADLAARSGMEFSLEQSASKSKGTAMNGFLTNSRARSAGLTLRCWWPQSAAEAEEADEEEAAEEETDND